MSPAQTIHVSLDPATALQRIRAEVADCYWFDILNYLLIRKPFVGVLGISQLTIWRNGFGRSGNRPRLKIFLEPSRHGTRIECRIEPPMFGDLFGTMPEDEPRLRDLVERLFVDVRSATSTLPDDASA